MGASKTLNVYLPADLYRQIEREARKTGKTKGGVVRDRLSDERPMGITGSAIADLFGVADDLPSNLSAKKDASFQRYGSDGDR